jgi:branched-chain amino acid transport system ATP-binding protein
MLDVRDLHFHYGSIHALRGVSLVAGKGKIICLIGGNGAGKTTLLNAVSGMGRPSGGSISWEGEQIVGVPPCRIVSKGVVQVPEGRQIFHPLSVLENLEMGAYVRYRKMGRKRIVEEMKEVYALFPVLESRAAQVAGTLSGGEQQMLAIARGLMAKPSLLLLDEPSLGLAPLIIAEIFRVIERLPAKGAIVLLVEQNARAALNVSHRGYVMETGTITMEGDAKALLDDEGVKRAFLGRERGKAAGQENGG